MLFDLLFNFSFRTIFLMGKFKKDKPHAASESLSKKSIPKERLDRYHELLRNRSHTVPEGIMPYKEWYDEDLVKEAKSKAADSISLIVVDWKLYLEVKNRGLLPKTYPSDYKD